MKTLYVSDLDGTLLRNDAQTSEYTNQVINQLTSDGILFSYATARSYLTATKSNKRTKCQNTYHYIQWRCHFAK